MAKKPTDDVSIKSKSTAKSTKSSFIEKASSGFKKLKRKATEILLSPKKKKKTSVSKAHAADTPVSAQVPFYHIVNKVQMPEMAAPPKKYPKATVVDVDDDSDIPEAPAEDEEAELSEYIVGNSDRKLTYIYQNG
jgi:hypothetical protein